MPVHSQHGQILVKSGPDEVGDVVELGRDELHGAQAIHQGQRVDGVTNLY